MFSNNTAATAILTLALVTGGVAVLAGPPGAGPQGAGRPDDPLTRMTEQLDLSEAQQQEIRGLLEAHRESADRDRAALQERIDGVLTAEQREAREARQQRRMERRLDRMAERLDLDETQQEQVATVFAQKREDPQMSRAEVHDALATVLTEDQLERLEAMRGRRGPGRHGGHGERDFDAVR